ncbi:hypothetical protein HanPSC8_Chr02g0050431 [Helianthus annuus]|nr:hypothetical protein HanPSC8_Chr02g0050431 [Helianthus annuus]
MGMGQTIPSSLNVPNSSISTSVLSLLTLNRPISPISIYRSPPSTQPLWIRASKRKRNGDNYRVVFYDDCRIVYHGYSLRVTGN